MKIFAEVPVRLVEAHQFFAVDLFRLVQRDKIDVLWRQGLVCERTLNGIEVMSSDPAGGLVVHLQDKTTRDYSRNQGALPRQILMELILQTDEGVVGSLCELDVAKDSSCRIRADLRRIF